MSSTSCLIHFKGDDGPLTNFSEVSFNKFLTSHQLWLSLDGQQRDIAEQTKVTIEEIQKMDNPSQAIKSLGYHRSCYSKFTNVTLIKRAQARCAKIQKSKNPIEEIEVIDNSGEETTSFSQKKMLRSSTSAMSSTRSRNQNILPPCNMHNLQPG